MKFRVTRYGIDVIPESDEDHAFIEDTLGLRKEGDWVPLVRRSVFGIPTALASLEARRYPENNPEDPQTAPQGGGDDDAAGPGCNCGFWHTKGEE